MSKRARGEHARRERDLYPTPIKSVRPLIPHLRLAGVRTFAEPCAGEGDLVRHLESFGLRCVLRSDIKDGIDPLSISRFDAPVISNTPYLEKLLVALVAHFIEAAPFTWLLLKADFAHVNYSRPFWRQCSDIVDAKREAHLGKGSGYENCCWYRFERGHRTGPIFHNGEVLLIDSRPCRCCGVMFRPRRSDALFCTDACKQQTWRARRRVTAIDTTTVTEGG